VKIILLIEQLCKPKLEIGMVGTMVHQSDLFSQLVT
jgi:hypothetical protein